MRELPRVRAERQLGAVYAAMIGSGRMKKHDAESYLSNLRRATRTEQPRKGARPTPAMLHALGVKLAPPPEKEK